MNELIVAEIDADVRESPIERVEKNQIARLQVLLVDGLTSLAHFIGSAWEIGATGFPKNITNQTAAIEALLWRIAAVAVAYADQRECFDRNMSGTVREAADFFQDSGRRLFRFCAGGCGNDPYGRNHCKGNSVA